MLCQRHHASERVVFSFRGQRFRLLTALIPLAGLLWAMTAPGLGRERRDAVAHYESFREVDGLFDASGGAQLPDGRLIVVQDDGTIPIALLRLDQGRFVADVWPSETLKGRSGGRIEDLSDLEDVVVSPSGGVYAVGSHARKNGVATPSREILVRFRLDGERMAETTVFTGLKPALAAAHPALAKAAAILDAETGLNIEGLTFDRDHKRLLIGLRAPVIDGRAVLATLENPDAVVEGAAPPRIGLVLLDLDGDGIRGIAWLPKLNGYLIASRADSVPKKGPYRLWFWPGGAADKPRPVSIDSLKSLRRPEGIAPVVIDGQERILIVSDEGNRADEKPSRVTLVAYDRLRIGP